LLLGASGLYAGNGMKDSVAKEEQQALANPSYVQNHKKADAKVEETISKDEFMAKLKTNTFNREVSKDEAQRVRNVINKEAAHSKAMFKKAPKEVTDGLTQTVLALEALSRNDAKTATKALQKATEDFNKALKANPSLGLVPIEQDIVAYEFLGSAKSVLMAEDIARSAIKKYDVQLAVDMLTPLKDEVDITVHYLPMDLYPSSTKIAQRLLKQGKIKEATRELILGFSTIVADEVVIPIPLISAQDLVAKASKLDKKNKKEVRALLEEAKDELLKAKYLGYTKDYEASYKELRSKINNIETEIKGKNRVKALYEDIKHKFNSLLHKTRANKKSIGSSLAKEHRSAKKEEDQDIVNFVNKGRLDAF
jgi:cellobiose-specific phosphotransferase system component IIA